MENFIDKFTKKETKKEPITEDQAYEIIDTWCESLEVRLKGDDLEMLKSEIWKAVSSERLTYDNESEEFSYVLKKPIEMKDGSNSISMIKIHESDMNGKKDIGKYKNDIETMAALYKAYCTDSAGNPIEFGFLMRIKDRDQSIISAVILGFFVQVVPGKK